MRTIDLHRPRSTKFYITIELQTRSVQYTRGCIIVMDGESDDQADELAYKCVMR